MEDHRKIESLENPEIIAGLKNLDYFKVLAAFLVVAVHTSPLSSFGSEADFILTRILARVAVPFFLMVTGYFVLPKYLFHRSEDVSALLHWVKKGLLLYAAVIVLYLPVNLYAGQLNGAGIYDVVRMIFFDGTFYHLWYLPASILGVLLVYLMSRKLSFQVVMAISLFLYVCGLLGDSYYGLMVHIPFLEAVYEALFHIFSYTRNGIFYAPIFLVMGAWMAQSAKRGSKTTDLAGLIGSLALMLAEGLTLHHLGVQRHDSMYIALLPGMFFLYRVILSAKLRSEKCKVSKRKPVKFILAKFRFAKLSLTGTTANMVSAKQLRSISAWIYFIHPLFIIAVRGGAKIVQLEEILIEQSLIHYIVVCFLSGAFAIVFVKSRALKHQRPDEKGRAWIEIDRKNLRQNVKTLSDLLPSGCQLMPAIKANAYGHGAALVAKELNACGVKALCVATVEEGIELRRNGIKGEILVLGYTHPHQFAFLRRYHLMQTVVDFPYAKTLNNYGKKFKVHLKIDTGMHRLGVRCERIEEICDIFQLKNLNIVGIFTHLCAADSSLPADQDFTLAQGNAFFTVISQLKERGYCCPKVHLQASHGLLNYPQLSGDYARIGIALYGVLSSRADLKSFADRDFGKNRGSDNDLSVLRNMSSGQGKGSGQEMNSCQSKDHCEEMDCRSIRLVPVLSMKARVASIRDLWKGEACGYGLQYLADQDQKVAALAIGYADGLPRSLSCGVGKVLINGREAPIIGRICMDQTLVDITGIPDVQQGDIAVILGKSGEREITAYDIAKQTGTITNEVLSRFGNRLHRVIV